MSEHAWHRDLINCTTGDNYLRGNEYLQIDDQMQNDHDMIEQLRLLCREQHLCLVACSDVFNAMGLPSNPEIGLGNIIAKYESLVKP